MGCHNLSVRIVSCAARTINYGRTGEYEYTQGGLAPDTNYDFEVNVCDQGEDCTLDADGDVVGNGWRGWSSNFSVITTTDAVDSALTAEDTACEEGGQVLTASEGTISRSLGRATFTSTCRWKINPVDLPAGSLVYLHFELHEGNDEFRVGENWFEPVPASAVTIEIQQVCARSTGSLFCSTTTVAFCRQSLGVVCCFRRESPIFGSFQPAVRAIQGLVP